MYRYSFWDLPYLLGLFVPVTGKMTRMSMVATLFFCIQYYKFSCRYTKKEGESERERDWQRLG